MKRNPAALPSPWTAWANEKQPAVAPAAPKGKQPPEWSGKTIKDYREMLDCFQGVTFQLGSFDKRFIRDMRGLDNAAKLTLKQVDYIEKCFHKYRGQIGAEKHKRLCRICGGKK